MKRKEYCEHGLFIYITQMCTTNRVQREGRQNVYVRMRERNRNGGCEREKRTCTWSEQDGRSICHTEASQIQHLWSHTHTNLYKRTHMGWRGSQNSMNTQIQKKQLIRSPNIHKFLTVNFIHSCHTVDEQLKWTCI